MNKVKIGVVGVGVVADGQYLPYISKNSHTMDLAATCDINRDRAEEMKKKHGAAGCFGSVQEMLEKAEIDCVVVLTDGPSHSEIARSALEAGKHVFVEKPLAPTLDEADTIIAFAKEKNLKLACAPGIALSDLLNQVRKIIRQGQIGKVCFIRTNYSHRGPADLMRLHKHLSWTDPSWFYRRGFGPLQDLAVYPLHAVTSLLGPARRVSAMVGTALPERTIHGGPMDGSTIACEGHDNSHLLLDFGAGTFATVSGTFCVWASKAPWMEIFGSEGTINLDTIGAGKARYEVYMENPDLGIAGWANPVGPVEPFELACGVGDLVESILEGREPRASAAHHRHVLEIQVKAMEASGSGQIQDLESTFPAF